MFLIGNIYGKYRIRSGHHSFVNFVSRVSLVYSYILNISTSKISTSCAIAQLVTLCLRELKMIDRSSMLAHGDNIVSHNAT